jgi:hypothetical protein
VELEEDLPGLSIEVRTWRGQTFVLVISSLSIRSCIKTIVMCFKLGWVGLGGPVWVGVGGLVIARACL